MFWVFPANPGAQTNFHGIAKIDGKYIKHISHSIINSSACHHIKVLFVLQIGWEEPTLTKFWIRTISVYIFISFIYCSIFRHMLISVLGIFTFFYMKGIYKVCDEHLLAVLEYALNCHFKFYKIYDHPVLV